MIGNTRNESMSLFATDAALLAPAPHNSAGASQQCDDDAEALVVSRSGVRPAVAFASAADVWCALLPQLTQHALRHGAVRSAALLVESAMSVMQDDDPAISQALRLVDAAAATDAAIQCRQLAGDMCVLPSQTTHTSGEPRFLVGIAWDEISHGAVQSFVQHELADGADVELRNFLDETLRPTDVLIDLDPQVGVCALTTLSAANGAGRVHVWQRDPVLLRLLQRNVTAAGYGERCTLTAGTPGTSELSRFAGDSRLVVHLGAESTDTIAAALGSWAPHACCIAWSTQAEWAPDCVAAVLDTAGFHSFVLAVRDDALELVPYAANEEAAYAFALSPAFVASLGACE
jgi:hypothetical protein